MASKEVHDGEVQIKVKNPDVASTLFKAYKAATGKQQLREATYLEHGDYMVVAINKQTFEARLVPVRDWK